MARKERKKSPKYVVIDYPNEDGTVDVWKFDTSVSPYRAVEVTSNMRRRGNSKN